jgi:DNA-binding FadR family transcriptional regulator
MNTATDSAGRVMTVTVPVVRPAEPVDSAQPLRPHTPLAAPLVFPRAAAQRGRGLHGQLVQQLGQMIVGGELDVDRPLVPEEIGQRFDVSRTVVRETLRVLEAKGLVSARPNVGTRVRPVREWNLLDPDVIEWRALGPARGEQCRELLELRQAVEPLAGQLAAGRMTPERLDRMAELVAVMREAATVDQAAYVRADFEFHITLLQSSGNRMIEHLVGVVYGALDVAGAYRDGCGEPTIPHIESHERLVTALRTGDGADAAARLRQLLGGPAAREQVLPGQRDQ